MTRRRRSSKKIMKSLLFFIINTSSSPLIHATTSSPVKFFVYTIHFIYPQQSSRSGDAFQMRQWLCNCINTSKWWFAMKTTPEKCRVMWENNFKGIRDAYRPRDDLWLFTFALFICQLLIYFCLHSKSIIF